MNSTQIERYVILLQHFPIKAHKIADSVGLSIQALRSAIKIGDYCIDDNCELVANELTIAINNLSSECKKAMLNINLNGGE